jgi:hypothetical protein
MSTPPSAIPGLVLVGFLERQRTCWPASAVETFPLVIKVDLDAKLAMIAEFAVQLPAVLPDCPEVLTDPRMTGLLRAVGRIVGLVAHGRSLVQCSWSARAGGTHALFSQVSPDGCSKILRESVDRVDHVCDRRTHRLSLLNRIRMYAHARHKRVSKHFDGRGDSPQMWAEPLSARRPDQRRQPQRRKPPSWL